MRRGLALSAFVSLLTVNGFLCQITAQTLPPPKEILQRRVSDVAVYGALIRAMAGLEEKTRASDSRAKGFRAAVSEKIGVSSSDFTTFVELCKSAEMRMKPLDARAQAIITDTRARYKGGKAGPVPPPPAELLDLQRQKDDIVRETIGAIDTRLSTGGKTKVRDYLLSLLGPKQVIRTK